MTSEDPREQTPEEPALSALYRATRREVPGETLDRAVLTEAGRALSRRRRRWLVPLSTAAVILLGVSLTLTQIEPPVPGGLDSARPERSRSSQTDAPALKRRLEEVAPPKPMLERQGSAPASVRERDAADRLFDEAFEALPDAQPLADPKAQKAQPAPEEWVAAMQRLLKLDERVLLRRELASFRQSYPDYPLPAVLEAFENGSE